MALENLELVAREYDSEKIIPRDRAHWVTRLQDLNLENELLLHYNLAKDFLESIQDDSSIPANQVASVMGTVSTILKELTKTQADLHNSEEEKKLEAALIATLKTLPTEAQELFLMTYHENRNHIQ